MASHQKYTLLYGHHDQQFGDLYSPKLKEKMPVVIVVHGGYWKETHTLNSYATKSIVDELKQYNIVIWNLEYRRMDAEGDNHKAPWPAVLLDVSNGVDYLKQIAVNYNLDLSRILIVGHSAGGHLATWVASRQQIEKGSPLYCENPLAINNVISIAGVLNLFSPNDANQPEQITRLLGGTSKQLPTRYLASDPTNLSSKQLNVTVVHGVCDTCINIAQAEYYIAHSSAKTEYHRIENGDHFSMLPHDGEWQESQWLLIKKLLADKINTL